MRSVWVWLLVSQVLLVLKVFSFRQLNLVLTQINIVVCFFILFVVKIWVSGLVVCALSLVGFRRHFRFLRARDSSYICFKVWEILMLKVGGWRLFVNSLVMMTVVTSFVSTLEVTSINQDRLFCKGRINEWVITSLGVCNWVGASKYKFGFLSVCHSFIDEAVLYLLRFSVSTVDNWESCTIRASILVFWSIVGVLLARHFRVSWPVRNDSFCIRKHRLRELGLSLLDNVKRQFLSEFVSN